MFKSDEMKSRSSSFIGVLLFTSFSPRPLIQESEPAKITSVEDILLFGKTTEYEENIDIGFLKNDCLSLSSTKPISWFLRNNVPLCTVSTVPFEHDAVHKPPWTQ